MAQCCLKGLSATAWGWQGGTVGVLPSLKLRALLLLSRGWKNHRCNKDETNHLNAVCYRPLDKASGNILARGISQTVFLIIYNKEIKGCALG